MLTITTKFHGPTNTRGARVTAQSGRFKVSLSWEYADGVTENHTRAAKQLEEEMRAVTGRDAYEYIGGDSPDGRGLLFIAVKTAGVKF